MLKTTLLSLLTVVVLSLSENGFANESQLPTIKVSIAQLPGLANMSGEGPLVDIVREMDKYYYGRIDITVAPFSRSLFNVHHGDADAHLPMLTFNKTNKNNDANMAIAHGLTHESFTLSKVPLFYPQFVLVSQSDAYIDPSNMYEYFDVFTDQAHQSVFPKANGAVTCLSCAIKMVSVGRIDGFIFGGIESRHLIERLGIDNLKITPLKQAPASFVVKRNELGDEVLKILESLLRKLQDSQKDFISHTIAQARTSVLQQRTLNNRL